MNLIAAEVKIKNQSPFELINEYWPFPAKNMKYSSMWILWKDKAAQKFGIEAIKKPKAQSEIKQPTEYQLDIFAERGMQL